MQWNYLVLLRWMGGLGEWSWLRVSRHLGQSLSTPVSVAGHVFTKMFMHTETHVFGPATQNNHYCLYGLNHPQIHMLKPYLPGPMNVTEFGNRAFKRENKVR